MLIIEKIKINTIIMSGGLLDGKEKRENRERLFR